MTLARARWNDAESTRRSALAWRGSSAECAQDVLERRGEQLARCLTGGLPLQPASRRGPVEAGPAFERVTQPRRVLGDVGVKGCEQRDGAAYEVARDAPHLGVGNVLAVRHRGEPDRAVGLGPVQPARHGIGHPRTCAATYGCPELFLASGGQSLEQPDVDLLASAEVVVHEPAGDGGGARDV